MGIMSYWAKGKAEEYEDYMHKVLDYMYQLENDPTIPTSIKENAYKDSVTLNAIEFCRKYRLF